MSDKLIIVCECRLSRVTFEEKEFPLARGDVVEKYPHFYLKKRGKEAFIAINRLDGSGYDMVHREETLALGCECNLKTLMATGCSCHEIKVKSIENYLKNKNNIKESQIKIIKNNAKKY